MLHCGCPIPLSTQHRKVNNNSVALSFIYIGKTIWEPLMWAFIHICARVAYRLVFQPFMHSCILLLQMILAVMEPLSGDRWEMAASLSSTQHDQNIVFSLTMLFIIVSLLILSSFNISNRVIESERQQSSRIWRLMGSFGNYWIYNIWVHGVSIGW